MTFHLVEVCALAGCSPPESVRFSGSAKQSVMGRTKWLSTCMHPILALGEVPPAPQSPISFHCSAVRLRKKKTKRKTATQALEP